LEKRETLFRSEKAIFSVEWELMLEYVLKLSLLVHEWARPLYR